MRFSSDEHLQTWAATGRFPEIHTPLLQFTIEHAEGGRLVDLCACFGLLGERLSRFMRGNVWAVEGNPEFVAKAKAAGVSIPFLTLRVTRQTLPELVRFIREARADVIVARRALPELWGQDLEGGRMFAEQIHAAGVREIFVEGRAKTANAVNALASIEDEIRLLSGSYNVTHRRGSMARLKAK